MNLPNRITLFRILLIPIIIIISLLNLSNEVINHFTLGHLLILILFLIGAFSDFLDGYIARKKNLITTFGKFADPLADKLLVLTLLIIMLEDGNILKGWVVIIILAREFIVTGFRILASTNQLVIAAGMLGKIKTNMQFLMIILLFLVEMVNSQPILIITNIVIYLTAFITLFSGFEYIVKNKAVILASK